MVDVDLVSFSLAVGGIAGMLELGGEPMRPIRRVYDRCIVGAFGSGFFVILLSIMFPKDASKMFFGLLFGNSLYNIVTNK